MFDQIPDDRNEMTGWLEQSAKDRGWGATVLGVLATIVVSALLVVLYGAVMGWGATDALGATRALHEQGFGSISITGYRWFTCGKNDYYHTGFKAVGPTGEVVTGTVCRGMIFKGATIRLD